MRGDDPTVEILDQTSLSFDHCLLYTSSTGAEIGLQANLDAILPGMLQLLAVFGIYWYFTHKGQNYIKLVFTILAISIIAAFFGILG